MYIIWDKASKLQAVLRINLFNKTSTAQTKYNTVIGRNHKNEKVNYLQAYNQECFTVFFADDGTTSEFLLLDAS